MSVLSSLLTLGIAAGAFPLGMVHVSAEELKEGDEAPNFKLPGSDDKTYELKDFRDRKFVVLAWFPRAFTPGCTAECKSLAAGKKKLDDFDVVYFTASTDEPEKNKKFAESVGAEYPILSDPTGETARAYGVATEDKKTATRWTFFIGKDGKILFIDKKVKTAEYADVVAEKLAELGAMKKKE